MLSGTVPYLLAVQFNTEEAELVQAFHNPSEQAQGAEYPRVEVDQATAAVGSIVPDSSEMGRRPRFLGAAIPVVLPLILVRPTQSGTFTISIDGTLRAGLPVYRGELGSVLARIAEQAGTPMRVEVHEPGGTVWADILTPPLVPEPDVALSETGPASDTGLPVTFEGFLAGETVLVARIVQAMTADAYGRIRLTRTTSTGTSAEIAAGGDVIVFGTRSGTVITSGLP